MQSINIFFYCKLCKQRFTKKPSAHPCFKSTPFVIERPFSSEWECGECGVCFTSKTGLDNHVLAHKKAKIHKSDIPIKVPPPSSAKKKNRRRKVKHLSEGEPGTTPLAVPPPPSTTIPVLQDQPMESPLIDVEECKVLCSFKEPLLHFLQHDDLPGATHDFFALVEDMVSVVREHFHLGSPPLKQGATPRRTRELDLQDPQAVQKCYAWNRRKLIRQLTSSNSARCLISRDRLTEHFSSIWQAPNDPLDLPDIDPPERTQEEVDPGSKILCQVFNACLKIKDIPPSWKKSSTILIHKDGEVDSVSNWRPIALSNTLYKLFTKCLARKLAEWCESHSVLSPTQKGFTPYDGVLEHNFLLAQHLEQAKCSKSDSLLAWLDVSNAFGSVPHEAILHALRAEGVDEEFLQLVTNIYVGASSAILTEEGPSDPLPILRGVKQGCPLSGILFNVVLNNTIKTVQGNTNEEKRILAFADDIVLLSHSTDQLQDLLNQTEQSLRRVALSLNPSKCATLHLSGSSPVGSRPSVLTVCGAPIKTLSDGDFYKYLGKPVGFSIRKDGTNINDAIIDGHKIATSQLAPWQKLDALKSFFFPSLNFAMRTGQFQKTDWIRVEESITKEVKEILALPLKASCSYLFGDSKQGACGVPEISRDSDSYLIDTAFKLLTSKDEEVSVKALAHLICTVRQRLKREPSNADLASFLSGSMEGEFHSTTSAHHNHWTWARSASRRQCVTWSFVEDAPSLHFNGHDIWPQEAAENTPLLPASSAHRSINPPQIAG
ncbi:retrovirus-related Pol polyprotein from type-1 retrotransposable element R2 [Trichonephila clavipes]|nr:retrovirus-related Pol polyprotein from type-1 retrotransposable element R2 [Trichonephila clavipes]